MWAGLDTWGQSPDLCRFHGLKIQTSHLNAFFATRYSSPQPSSNGITCVFHLLPLNKHTFSFLHVLFLKGGWKGGLLGRKKFGWFDSRRGSTFQLFIDEPQVFSLSLHGYSLVKPPSSFWKSAKKVKNSNYLLSTLFGRTKHIAIGSEIA